ncbi:hypothetical protein Bhyg_15923 [Pseudolycoriella hygida]|uniref:Uncharacterized protein n=1 Tax=Pseudolycoriella hygida TaxID=35572 RepID=A0A9Q0RU05_9DIPT|nr:hypothetical protein Bhyg_15923 [Pseudolycoriella hygida]
MDAASQKITASLWKALKKGKTVDAIICFKQLDHSESTENGTEEVNQEESVVERTELLEKSMAAVIDILEEQKNRISFTWKLLYESNMINVRGADVTLIENIATVENVENVDKNESNHVDGNPRKSKIWNSFKSLLNNSRKE